MFYLYQVDNQSFSAHRVILASQIPFFNAMFSQDYAEYSKKEIELKEIDAEVSYENEIQNVPGC